MQANQVTARDQKVHEKEHQWDIKELYNRGQGGEWNVVFGVFNSGTICRLRMVSGVPSVLGLEEEKLKHSFHMHRYRCSVFFQEHADLWRKEDIQLRLISSESPDDGSGSLSVVQLYSEVGLADTATHVSQPANSFPSLQLSSKELICLGSCHRMVQP